MREFCTSGSVGAPVEKSPGRPSRPRTQIIGSPHSQISRYPAPFAISPPNPIAIHPLTGFLNSLPIQRTSYPPDLAFRPVTVLILVRSKMTWR